MSHAYFLQGEKKRLENKKRGKLQKRLHYELISSE